MNKKAIPATVRADGLNTVKGLIASIMSKDHTKAIKTNKLKNRILIILEI